MASRTSDTTNSQAVVTSALVSISVWVAGSAGLGLLAVTALSKRGDALILGVIALGVAAVGAWQRHHRRPRPLVMLLTVATACAGVVPFLHGAGQLMMLPALTLFALLGIFTLPRKIALWFAVWSGVLTAWSVFWLSPSRMVSDALVTLILIAAIGVAAWRLLSLAGDVAIREEENFRLLFDSSPVAIMEEDFTDVERQLDKLRARGIEDLRGFLRRNPEETARLISLIRIRRTNPAAIRMIEAGSADDMPAEFSRADRREVELSSFIEQFVTIWDGGTQVALDLEGLTLEGRPLEAVLHWAVPMDQGRRDLSRVIVTISDITPRKVIEERLAEAVERNQRMLAFEHALAACSRALLIGSGEDALEVALESLRAAIGADRTYFAVNEADSELGACFRVVSSVSRAEHAHDDWVGMSVPWSKYPTALGSLTRGEPFQHVATDQPGQGWNRSLLAVPVSSGGQWIGTLGFVDIERPTTWGEEPVRMLEVAAPMIATFREREATRQRLEDLVRSKDRFIASVSHELRTPLAAVLGFADELKRHAASFQPDELTEILELIADQSQDMTDMVEDLLVAARADIGTISIRAQEVFLRSQAESAIAGLGREAIERVEVIGGPGRAWADPTRTRQIIRNLLTNAIRYGGEKITVLASNDDQQTTLGVRDDGPGLPKSEWERIFEPYERAHDRPSQPASIGLGLTVSRQLARLMGGELSYRAEAAGSVFELALPTEPGQERTSEAPNREFSLVFASLDDSGNPE